MNANDLKDQGNMCFAARRFNDAVSCYTKAIVSNIFEVIRASTLTTYLYLYLLLMDLCKPEPFSRPCLEGNHPVCS